MKLAEYAQSVLGDEPWQTDVFSPGGPIVSTGVGSGQAQLEGTSIAAAVTTGAILLLQEFFFEASDERPAVDDIEKWLREGGRVVGQKEGKFVHLDIYGSLGLAEPN